MNLENLKRIIYEKKYNQDWRTVKTETEKKNEILIHISTKNITELNELINAGAKIVCEKIAVPQKNTNRNSNLLGELDRKSG